MLALTLLSEAIVRAPFIGALLTVLGWLILGYGLAILIASRRWILASLVVVVSVLSTGLFLPRAAPPGAANSSSSAPPPDLSPSVPTTAGSPNPPTVPPDLTAPGGGSKQVPVDLEPFRRFSKQLVDGVVGFDYPRRMTAEDRSDVRLRVSVQKALQELRDSLTRDGRQPIVEAAKLSPRMKADLQGFGFDITSLSSSEQALDADEDTTWIWDVRAKEAGTQKLTVTLTALIDVGDSEGARDVSTFYREVEVEALPRSWSQRALDIATEYGPSRDIVWPAIPTVAAAIWAFIFARRRGKRKRARRA